MNRILFASFFWLLLSCGGHKENQETLKIACAANMQLAMDSIARIFKEDHNIQIDLTAASSGMLTAQIENGAPYDIFLSANMSYPERLFNNGLTTKPKVYAQGRLVFVCNKKESFRSIDEALNSNSIKRIAIANNETAPYGMAANTYLERKGVDKAINEKLVIGESVGQVNQYITTNVVEGGFTSYSFKVKNNEDYLFFEVDPTQFDPINQGVVIINQNETTEKFVDYLLSSEKCDAVLQHFGYFTN